MRRMACSFAGALLLWCALAAAGSAHAPPAAVSGSYPQVEQTSAALLYLTYDPLVVHVDRTLPVTLTVKTDGSPLILVTDLNSGDAITATALTTDTYRLAFTPQQVLYGYTAAYNHNFFGHLNVQAEGAPDARINLVVNVSDASVPSVGYVQLASDARAAPHVLNLLRPGVSPGSFDRATTRRFYELYADAYDFLNLVYVDCPVANRSHLQVSNTTQGIGLTLFNRAELYGSARRLQGITCFPISSLFDGASDSFQHELGHQWANFVLAGCGAHWPISELAQGVMGFGLPGLGCEGLQFPFEFLPNADGSYTLHEIRDLVWQVGFTDLDLYLMGLLPAAQVRAALVFTNQDQAAQIHDGGILQGPTYTVDADTLIGTYGPRIPNASTSPKEFTVATIIVSRDRLLDEAELAFFDYMASRASFTQPVLYASGGAHGTAKPFYLTTRGLGRLNANMSPLPIPTPTHTSTPTPTPTITPGTVNLTLQAGLDGYSGAQDTYIQQYAAQSNYCQQDTLRVGYKAQYAALLRFDVGTIPTGAQVTRAILQVYASGWGGSNIRLGVYCISRTAELCQATWSIAQAGQTWGLPGVNDTTNDRRASPESTLITSGIGRWYEFDLTNAVGGWVDGALVNHGVLLRQIDATAYVFMLASAENATSAHRPKLLVTYRNAGGPTPTPTHTPTHTPTATATSTPGSTEIRIILQQGYNGYTSAQDTHIFTYDESVNHCTQDTLHVGYRQQNAALLRFDLSPIPSGATITHATLQLYATGWSGINTSAEMLTVLRAWNVCQATWARASTDLPWGVPGCKGSGSDYVLSPRETTTLNGIARWYSWDVTGPLQAWLSGQLANNGVLIRQDTFSSAAFQFASSERASQGVRPRLIVTYR